MFIEAIMTPDVHTVSPASTLASVQDIFKQVCYHHLIVVEEGKLVGLLSDRDVLKNVSPFCGDELERDQDREQMSREVRDFMSVDLVTIDRESTVDYASILLLENNISCLPVVCDSDRLLGIVTWKDILKYHVYS